MIERPGRLAQKRAVITGAGTGIGLATARLFATHGARVLLHSRTEVNVTRAADEVTAVAPGVQVEALHGPLEDPATGPAIATAVADRFGGLDILVNNAAIDNFEPLDEISHERWRQVLDVNLNGVFMLTRELLPLLRSSGAGAIVNVASAAALIGTPGMAAYTASKGALVSLTRQLAIEYAPDNLRVNSLCPGSIDTPMFRESLGDRGDPEQALSDRVAQHPLGRIGRPDDIALAVLYLASDESSFVTGANLPVDGGLTAA